MLPQTTPCKNAQLSPAQKTSLYKYIVILQMHTVPYVDMSLSIVLRLPFFAEIVSYHLHFYMSQDLFENMFKQNDDLELPDLKTTWQIFIKFQLPYEQTSQSKEEGPMECKKEIGSATTEPKSKKHI